MNSIGRKLEQLSNIGDIIICIKNEDVEYYDETLKDFITLNKTYKVIDIRTMGSEPIHFLIKDDKDKLSYFDIDCFMSLQEFRQKKIDSIIQ